MATILFTNVMRADKTLLLGERNKGELGDNLRQIVDLEQQRYYQPSFAQFLSSTQQERRQSEKVEE